MEHLSVEISTGDTLTTRASAEAGFEHRKTEELWCLEGPPCSGDWNASPAPIPCQKLFGQTHRENVLTAFRAFAADAASGLQLLEVSYHACLSGSAATAARVADFLKHQTLETPKMTAAVDRSLHHIQGKIDSGVQQQGS